MTDLSAPSAGLRRPGVRLLQRSNAVAKVDLRVPPGAALVVDDDDVIAQLRAHGAFTVADDEARGGAGAGDAAPSAAATSAAEAPRRRGRGRQ